MSRIVAIVIVGWTFIVGGCAGPVVRYRATSAPPVVKGIWLRADGQSGRNNPAITQQFAGDKAACATALGIDRACMAQRGYLLVPENEVEAKASELKAAAGGAK